MKINILEKNDKLKSEVEIIFVKELDSLTQDKELLEILDFKAKDEACVLLAESKKIYVGYENDNYDCIEVTPHISSSILGSSDVVVAFVGQSEHLSDQCSEVCYVMQRYLNVLDKIAPIYPHQYKFMKESASFEAEVLEGTYSFPPKG